MSALVARARGLEGRILDEAVLAEIERAGDARTLAAALGRAGLLEDASYATLERAVRRRVADDLAVLARWSSAEPEAMTIIELEQDCQSLRAIVRGLAAGVSPERRRTATMPTSRLPDRVLVQLSEATTLDELHRILSARSHPLATAFQPDVGHGDRARAGARRRSAEAASVAIPDVLEVEVALTKAFAASARAETGDRALEAFVHQAIDAQNAMAALLLAARGSEISRGDMFAPGGERLTQTTFTAAAASSIDTARERLAEAFAGTPLARALRSATPGAVEDAALDWQLATQHALRREVPLGHAAILHVVLRRRAEARRLRRAVWRLALGGAR